MFAISITLLTFVYIKGNDMTTIDTNKEGLTIYYYSLEDGGGVCSILDEDYNDLSTGIFGHTRKYAIELAREERRRLTEIIKNERLDKEKTCS
jgi:hypothetical protein